MRLIICPYFVFFVAACDINDARATLVSYVETDGMVYSFYEQQMWDGTIQYLVSSSEPMAETVPSPNGEPQFGMGTLIFKDFAHGGYLGTSKLENAEGGVTFCSASGCKHITSKGKGTL